MVEAKIVSPSVSKFLQDLDAVVDKLKTFMPKESWQPKDKHWVTLRLLHLGQIDQYIRRSLGRVGQGDFSEQERQEAFDGVAERMHLNDMSQVEELKGFLQTWRWFPWSEFGHEADDSAWLIVQHADHDRAFQKEVLGMLEELVAKQEVNPSGYAYLCDRIAIGDEKPQRFGTQGECIDGRWVPLAIHDEENVDVRRREVGLGPLVNYTQLMQKSCP
jgi:hypothetical protein